MSCGQHRASELASKQALARNELVARPSLWPVVRERLKELQATTRQNSLRVHENSNKRRSPLPLLGLQQTLTVGRRANFMPSPRRKLRPLTHSHRHRHRRHHHDHRPVGAPVVCSRVAQPRDGRFRSWRMRARCASSKLPAPLASI